MNNKYLILDSFLRQENIAAGLGHVESPATSTPVLKLHDNKYHGKPIKKLKDKHHVRRLF